MSVSLIATLVFVDKTPQPARKTSITEPLRALRHQGLAVMSVTALLYNWGFFALLAFTPFPTHLGIHELGYVFTAWGVPVAIFAVFVAPRAHQSAHPSRGLRGAPGPGHARPPEAGHRGPQFLNLAGEFGDPARVVVRRPGLGDLTDPADLLVQRLQAAAHG
jgi:hypothetical protein